jgi:hypothetical protein
MSELITVTCQQIGHTLTKDIIPSYSKAISDGKKPTDILTDLLAYQETASVVLGGVSTLLDTVISIEFTWLDIWSACKMVRDITGGFLYVDFDPDDPLTRRLWLTDALGESKGQQIRLGKNLTAVTHVTDYMDMVNRLYPVGSSALSLTSKTYSRVDPVKSADATYGYLKIPGLYAAYKDWSGVGDARPANVTVEKPTGSWVLPTSHLAGSGWMAETSAYDNDTGTLAYYAGLNPEATSPYLTLYRASTASTQVRIYLSFDEFAPTMPVSVEVYYSAAWHVILEFNALPSGWNTITFAQQNITGVRVRFYNNNAARYYVRLVEVQIWDSTGWTNDNANWVQGADERTLRCAIANYVAAANYVVSYTHAAYLIALDDIASRDEIFSQKIDIDVADVDTLLARGRSKLTDLKSPIISIDTGLIDLSTEEGREFEELALGDTVTIIAESLGIKESVPVVSISKPDLHQPQNIVIGLATKTKDFIDYTKG